MTDILHRRAPETTHVPAALSSPEVSTVAALLGLLPNCKVVYAFGWLGLSVVQGSVVSESMPESLTVFALVAGATAYFVGGALVVLGARQVGVVKGTPKSRTGGLPQRTVRTTGRSEAMRFRSIALAICRPSCHYAPRSDARLTIRSSSLTADHQPLGSSSVLACGGVSDPPRDRGTSRRLSRRRWLAVARNLQTHVEIDVTVRVRLALDASRRQRAQMRFGAVVVGRYG